MYRVLNKCLDQLTAAIELINTYFISIVFIFCKHDVKYKSCSFVFHVFSICPRYNNLPKRILSLTHKGFQNFIKKKKDMKQ